MMFYGFDHWELGELVGGMNFYGFLVEITSWWV